jgi:hypothetical protein
MILDSDDSKQFFKLHKALFFFVNQRLKVVEPSVKSAGAIVALSPEDRIEVRDALIKRLDLIDAFVAENPFELSPEELRIVNSWHDLLAGQFYVVRFLKKHTVFRTATREPTVAYGVMALSEPLELVIDQPLPFLCKAVLLPFHGRIVYDGVLSGYNIVMGSNIRRELNNAYNDAKKRHGIVTSLRWNAEQSKPATQRGASRKKRSAGAGALIGRWRITWMEAWDQDFVDEEVEGFMEFDRDRMGHFQFGYVRGTIDYRQVERDGKPAVEFSWYGNDEMDPAQGRGWAVLDGDEIEGRIYIHRGDDSAFRAVRKESGSA